MFPPTSSRYDSRCSIVKQGHIPSTIGRLVNLTQLDLAFNCLSGKIPSEVSECVESVLFNKLASILLAFLSMLQAHLFSLSGALQYNPALPCTCQPLAPPFPYDIELTALQCAGARGAVFVQQFPERILSSVPDRIDKIENPECLQQQSYRYAWNQLIT